MKPILDVVLNNRINSLLNDGTLSNMTIENFSITLDKIQKLRMFCTHPLVYNDEIGNVDPALISRKYERLCYRRTCYEE